MADTYTITSRVTQYPGMDGWFFAHVSKPIATQIKEKHAPKKRGFGSIRVSVVCEQSTWDTSIFPDAHSGTYVLPLKKAIRQREDIVEGDTIVFTITIT